MQRALLIVLLIAAAADAQEFRSSAIAGHMKFLASDLLEGRAAGTRGYDIAASYVASQFEGAGLEPGNGSSYFQNIPFLLTRVDPRSSLTIQPDRGAPMLLKFGDAFVTSGDPLHADRTISGRIVVAGYGVTAPELGHDDYANIDVRGKVVVIFSGAPSRFEPTVRAHYSSSSGKVDSAAAHGAIGMIVLDRPDDDTPTPWPNVARNYGRGTMHWLEPNGSPHAVNAALTTSIRLHPDVAASLFEAGGRKLADVAASLRGGTFRPFELSVTAKIQTVSSHERVESANVVGLVRGSDPKLRDEYIVFSSHLDHIGIT
ncbi:MAG TPA: PA domain-containing protein, partial [Thermoanaerobaculia bacterium]